MALIICSLAFVVGFLGSLLGVGGGIFLVPAMVVGLDMKPHIAMPISLMCALATAISGTSIASCDEKIIKRALIFEPAAIVGALIFSPLAYLASGKQIMLLFAVFIASLAASSWRSNIHTQPLLEISERRKNFFGACVAFSSGASAGLFGIGGGVLLVPLLRLFSRIPVKEAMQISLFIMISTSAITLIVYSSLIEIPWKMGLAAVLGAIPAGKMGSFWRKKISDQKLSNLFVVFSLFVSMALLVKAFYQDGL